MLNIFAKKKSPDPANPSLSLTWDPQASSALQQALAQAPVPAMMKGLLKKEMAKSAEEHARKMGHTSVTAEDLMNGLMAKLPDNMKSKVEDAMKKGPDELKKLIK